MKHPVAKISLFGITHLQKQNPLMIAWWSAVFPGFGHYMLNQYFRATALTLSEVISNSFGHINEAIMYTYCGQFELATSVLDPRWTIGYFMIYCVTIWDSYRSAIHQKKLCQLAYLENVPIPRMKILSSGIQYLEKRKPLVGAAFSFFSPGLGQLYNHRIGLACYAMCWWWLYLVLSGFHAAFIKLMHGDIQASTQLLNPHWLLFMPSVMGGAIYHSYVTAIEHSRLYRMSQRQELSRRYGGARLRIFE